LVRAHEPSRLRVLVIDRSPPTDLTQGSSLIAYHVFPRLAHHELTLVCPALRELEGAEAKALEQRFHRIVVVPRKRPVSALGGWVEAKLASGPAWPIPRLDVQAARGFRQVVRRLAMEQGFDVIHTRGLPMAPFAVAAGAERPRMLEMGDSTALGARRGEGGSLRGAARAWLASKIESQTLPGFDVVTTVADADAAEMRRLSSRARVEVVPTGVDSSHFRPLSVAEAPANALFVGAMSYPPNVAAALWFANEVLPRIRSRRADARFVIVGRNPAPEIQALAARPGIEVTGLVPDVRPHVAAATVVVVPMVSGSGIKNKVMEALAMARPVVATRLGVEGVAVTAGTHLLVADEAPAFAEAVLRLFADAGERRRLGESGRQFIEAHYTWDACARRYDALYRELAGWSVSG
jgi:glycosyltransferase involved in cell wall biosynthesis